MQLNNVWNYKHCFTVRTSSDTDGDIELGGDRESKNYFELKKYSLL